MLFSDKLLETLSLEIDYYDIESKTLRFKNVSYDYVKQPDGSTKSEKTTSVSDIQIEMGFEQAIQTICSNINGKGFISRLVNVSYKGEMDVEAILLIEKGKRVFFTQFSEKILFFKGTKKLSFVKATNNDSIAILDNNADYLYNNTAYAQLDSTSFSKLVGDEEGNIIEENRIDFVENTFSIKSLSVHKGYVLLYGSLNIYKNGVYNHNKYFSIITNKNLDIYYVKDILIHEDNTNADADDTTFKFWYKDTHKHNFTLTFRENDAVLTEKDENGKKTQSVITKINQIN